MPVCECVCILYDLGSAATLYYKTNEQQRSLECSKTWDFFLTVRYIPHNVQAAVTSVKAFKSQTYWWVLNLCCCCFEQGQDFLSGVPFLKSHSVISSYERDIIPCCQRGSYSKFTINQFSLFFGLLIRWTTSWSETHVSALVEQESACREYLAQLSMHESLEADLSCVTL